VIRLENATWAVPGLRVGPVRLHVRRGEHVLVTGPSGAGKSLLLDVLVGVQPLQSGERWWDGRRLAPDEAPGVFGWLPQDPALFPHLSARDNILFGPRARHLGRRASEARLAFLAVRLELADLLDRRSECLSGGERQRVGLARALAGAPAVLLLDEPFAALEPDLRARLWQFLADLHDAEALTIVHVTHDWDEAGRRGLRQLRLDAGGIVDS
jgi:ABC-type nitrate/sulfonate/bicarbonate transport system ATPase subunit